MNGNKKPMANPLVDNGIDPVTGLTPTSTKRPPSINNLLLSTSSSIYGSQDVGDYFDRDSKYDVNVTRADLDNLERERALKQPNAGKMFNAVVGGVASGLLTAVETSAHILNLKNHIERLTGAAHAEQNLVSEFAGNLKEKLGKEMPIYRYDSSKVFDWSDPGFYWSTVKGILDSAVGFAIPGMGATKAVGAVQNLARLSAYLNIFKTSKATAGIINSLASGFISNLGEGMIMAVEQFENSMGALQEGLIKDNFEQLKESNPDLPMPELYKMAQELTTEQLKNGKEKYFREIAGQEADNFIAKNRLLMFTDAIGLHGLYQGKGFTRALIKEKGFLKNLGAFSADNMLIQAGKEGLEEISQNILQMEGEYQSKKKAGMDVSDTPDNLLARAYEFGTSDQALLEGMMGLFGGGPQRILTEAVSGNYLPDRKAARDRQYKQQQEQIALNTDFLNKKLANFAKAKALRAEAISKGEDNIADYIKDSEFLGLAIENFVRGTTEIFERQLQDVVNGVTEQERIANGWDENYQQQAQDQLDKMKELEKAYNKYTRYENQGEVFENRESRKLVQQDKERIQNAIEDVAMELDSQEDRKDPELVKAQESYDRQLTRANEILDRLDTEYKDMISAKKQQAVRKQKEELIKSARKAGKDIKEKRRKEAQEKHVEDRKNINKKKSKLQKEDESEEEIKKPAPDIKEEVEDVEPDISTISDIYEDEGPDVTGIIEPVEDEFAGDPDINGMNPDQVVDKEKKKVSQDQFDSASDKLFDDFEKTVKPEALIEGEGLSEAQKRLGLLETMMEKAAEVKGKENITFDELIDMLLDRHGKKRVGMFYKMLQGIWVQTHPDHVWINSLEEHLELNSDEEKELENDEKEAGRKVNGQFTNATIEEVEAEFEQITKEVAEDNNPSSGLMLEYLRVESGSGILAYLSRLYRQTKNLFYVQRKDIDNYINNELEDKGILDPDKYPVGTKVTLVVEDDDNVKVYVDSTTTGEKTRTTWGAKKASWKANRVEGETQRYNELYEEEVPIGVYVDGKRIAHLHETSWINSTNIHGNVAQDKERSKKIRKYIVEQKSFETTISGRTTGFLWRVANKKLITTSEALPDSNLPIVVVKNGVLYTSRNETYSGKLLNKTGLKEGIAYTVIPSAGGLLAVPLMNNKLSENPNIAKTIRKVLEIYMSRDERSEAQAIVNEIYNASGHNITTAVGVSEFINMFIHLTDVGKGTLTLKDYLLKNTTVRQTRDGFATSFIRDGGLDLQFEIALGRGLRSATVSRERMKNLSIEKREILFKMIEDNLNEMFINVSLDSIGNQNKGVFVLNEATKPYNEHIRSMTKSAFLGQNVAEEGQKPKYIYNVQPVITLDFNKIDGNDVQTGKPIIPQKEEPVEVDAPVTPDQAEKEEGPKYDTNYEGDMDFTSDFEESLMPRSIVPLTTEEVEEGVLSGVAKVTDLAEVTEVGQDEVRGVIISAFGSVAKQDQITDYIRSKVVDKIFTETKVSRNRVFKEVRGNFIANLNKLKANLATATKAGDQMRIDHFTKAIIEVNIVLNNWSKLEKLVIKQMNRIDNIKVIEYNDEVTEEEEEAENETAHYSEAAVFTTPPTDRLAPQVKQFLSGIGKWKEDPNNKGEFIPDKNYLGSQKTMDFWDVYNILQRITPNLRPSYNDIIKALKEHNEAFPFLNEVITKLENAPQQLRNQFVSGMTNHAIDMKFVEFGRNDSGAFELRELDSDANAIQRVILNDWNGKILERIGKINPEGDDVILDPALVNVMVSTWKRFESTHKYTVDELASWLGQLGIDLTEQTWRDIEAGKYKHKGVPQTLESFVEKTVMKVLAKYLEKAGNTSLIMGGDRIVDQTVVKAFARHDSKYRKSSFSNSQKSGVKTVYSYSLNKFLVNRIRELKEDSFLSSLAKLSFNGQSAWMTALMDEKGGFKENFRHWTVALEAIKKAQTKSRNNRELNKLSEGEIELFKIAMLQSDREDLSGKNQRIINVVYPTTSDKTSVMGLTVVAQKLMLDREGNIENESIDKIVDLVARPEIQRIKIFQAKNEINKINLKGYNKGASQFLMFPELNTLTWISKDGSLQKMFNGDGTINADIDSTEAMTAIRNSVKEHFNSLLEEKLDIWKKNNIGLNPKTGAFQYLHQSFLMGTTAKGANPLTNVNVQSKVKAAATDMVFQYLIANAEVHKLFSGDPALYYKQAAVNRNKSKTSGEYDFVADAKETYANINKRLAADIAPGMELAEANGDMYTQIILKDSASASLARFEITEILDGKEKADKARETWKKFQIGEITEDEFMDSVAGLVSEKYYAFDGTDAQEYVTWQEHLHVMKQLGEISEEQYNNAYATLEKGDDLSRELMDKVMQPMKPVYVDNKIDEANDVEKRVYIKSSAFPLFPQLTRGLQLDNLRIALEGVDKETKRVRAAFVTAVKVGGVDNAANIWGEDGTILSSDKISFEGSMITLDRKGFRIQQTVPYDPKKAVINKVTQTSKNLFVNMLEVEDFIFDGKKYTGLQLQEVYHELYGKLHEIERSKLIDEVGYDEATGKIADISKLRALLIKESRERTYPLSDQELVELDKELKFLAFSSSANKYESLLNSLVTSRIIRLKMPGKSFVLGSQEGFKGLATESKEEIAKREGIIFTDSYDPKVGLKPARIENGVRKASQALLPWKFKTKDGKKVSITKYIKDGKIDLTKVPEEVLQLFGMRIPNQGPNSQAWIEIVGFLPEQSGDLIITTRDFVVQMGSDFDVDKLYTYMYGYYFDNDGNIKVHREKKETNESDVLKNKIIDIHLAIHKNPDKRVQSQIANPLSTWKLKEFADDIVKLRNERESSEGKKFFTGLSDNFQREKFKEGTAGKDGVAVFSVDNMFNAVAQGKNLVFMMNSKESLRLNIGGKQSNGKLSEERTLDGKDYKSDVIAGYQSAAVDNAKEPILDKLNINTHTFKVIKILNQLGFTDEVAYILAQDIIIDYVNELERMSSSMAEFNRNREEAAYGKMLEKYGVKDYDSKIHGKFGAEEATIENLKNYIELGEKAPNYRYAQIAILDLFKQLDGYGMEVQTLQSTINPDSRGVGKTVIESLLKEDQVYKLIPDNNVHIANAPSLIGEIKIIGLAEEKKYKADGYKIRRKNDVIYAIKPKTINGHAIVHGLFTANDMWSHLFPYESSVMRTMFKKIERLTRTSNNRISNQAERRKDIWNNFKSFIFSGRNLGLFDTSITAERERLLYDRWVTEKGEDEHGFTVEKRVKVKESLGSFLLKVQETGFAKNSPFLSKLTVEVNLVGAPTIIKFNASAAENLDETNIYAAIVDMITRTDGTGASPTIGEFNGKSITLRDLAQELILYAYITGGIQEAAQFVKYIPASYLVTMPFAEQLSNIQFIDNNFGVNPNENPVLDYYYNVPPFVEQFIQHNPDQVPIITMDEITKGNSKTPSNLVTFDLNATTLKRIGEGISLSIDPKTASLEVYPPVYVSIQNDKAGKKYNLYKYSYAEKIYIQIDTLGSFANEEYNSDTPKQISLVRRNKANSRIKGEDFMSKPKTGNPLGDTVDDDMDITSDMVKEDKETVTGILDSLTNGTMNALKRTDGKNAIKEILNEAKAKTKDLYLGQLIQEIYNEIDTLPDAVSVHFNNRVDSSIGGYYTLTQTDEGDDAHTLLLNTTALAGRSIDYNIQTILHELIHGLTAYKIKYYWAVKTSDLITQESLLKSSPKLSVNKREQEIIRNIEVLWTHAKNVITSDPQVKRAYDKFTEKVGKHSRGERMSFSKEEIGTFYGLTSLSEFVSVALTNAEFAQILNNILAPNKQKTLLQSLMEKLAKLLQAITTFKAREGSVLEQTIYNVLDFVNQQESSNELQSSVETKIKGKMTFSYGNNKREDVTADDTFEAIKRGERTATTRYESDGNIEYWKKLKVGDKVEFESATGEKLTVTVTKAPYKLAGSGLTANEWSKLEGWSVEYFNSKVKPKLNEAWEFQYELDANEITQKEEEEIITDTKTFVENGTYYKFNLKNGVPFEGWYSQGNPNNWKPITQKTLFSAYQRLSSGAREINSKATLEENQMTLENGSVITFNDEQFEALEKLKAWMKSGDTYFTLSGFAGTGKTTIIRKALDTFLPRSVAVSAPTHKAKRVIQATTGRTGVTIHSLLNIKPDMDVDNLDPNNLEFARDKNTKQLPAISRYSVVIIDEASMMNKGLFTLLLAEAKKYGTRVIFMGDEAQIPPVGELMSEVFTSPEIKHKAHLQKVERQADSNPLFGVYDAIRDDISSPKDKFDHETKLNDKGEGIFFTPDHETFQAKVIEAFTSQKYDDDPNAFKLITYTNRTGEGNVAYWNKIIRAARMPNAKLFIEVGDILMGYKTIGQGEDINIENSADYKIIRRSELITDVRGIQGYKVTLENTFDGETTNVFIISRTQENLNKYRTKLAELAENAKKNRPIIGGKAWIPYFRFRESYVLFGDIMNEDGTVAVVGDINYGYAITAHKSQGSTYETVFIDENNINKYDQWNEYKHITERKRKKLSPLTKEDVDTERNKIKYVALSRPSKSAVVLSNKTKSEKNSFVQKPITDMPTSEDWKEMTQGLEGMPENIPPENDGGFDLDQFPDDILPFDNFDPKSIVSDQEVNDFMKRCK